MLSDIVDLFTLEAGFIEMFVRGTTIYWFLYALLRISGRRDLGSLGVADLLVLVLVADAAGNAMSGDSQSLGDGMIVVATIVGWSFVIDRVGYFSPLARRLLEPSRVCLVKDGRIVHHGMRQEHLTRGELMEQLRIKGVGSIGQVKRAYMESNGEFSVITRDTPSEGADSTLLED